MTFFLAALTSATGLALGCGAICLIGQIIARRDTQIPTDVLGRKP